ncbi:RnfH family protein [Acinetobacter soli]|uniref:RnfH family protein n=1 Tax=Acinetobacter soli TaxID=487316 RepID=UPI000DD0A527|nr:RnfH family protein [Acinetobacter soli]RSB51330.1 RnfH family protein [Acinetobacter soli]
MSNLQQVWVAYAAPDQQFHLTVAFEAGMTAIEAIEKSGLLLATQLEMPLQVGIFGIRCALEQPLKAGDRVEVYRALTINPKDIRRKRAEKNPVGRFQKGNRFK